MSTPAIPLFVRKIEVGKRIVHRPLAFYVGLNKDGRASTSRLIREHGGDVKDHPGTDDDSNIIALVEANARARLNSRTAYSVNYVKRCITEKKLLDLESFRIVPVRAPGPRKQQLQVHLRPGILKKDKMKSNRSTVRPDTLRADKVQQNHRDDAQATPVSTVRRSVGKVDEPMLDTAPGIAQVRRAAPAGDKGRQVEKSSSQVERPGDVVEKCSEPNLGAGAWTHADDKWLFDLYRDGKGELRKRDRDVSAVRKLPFWFKMEKHKLLPPKRTAEDCLRRLLQLRRPRVISKENKKMRRSSASNKTVGGTIDSETASSSPGEAQTKNAKRMPHVKDLKRKCSEEQSSGTTSSDVVPAKRTLRKPRIETARRRKIVQLVKGLAERGGVSEKRAFRVLRNERGDWRKALNALHQRQKGYAS